MELIDESSSSHRDEKVDPGNLLEQYWFFGKLLIDTKPKISRCYSDLCHSSNCDSQEDMLIRSEKSSPSTKKHPKGDNFSRPKLVRAPSLPSSMDRTVDIAQEKQSHNSGGRKSNPQHNLIRAPSLPPCIGKEEEEEEDQESEFTLGRLIRQASLNSSDMLPPRQTSKSSSNPKKICPRKKPDQLERIINMEGCNDEMGCLTNQAKIRRSLSDVQTKEVEGFKALSLKVEKEGSKQGVANKFPSVPEKGRLKSDEKMARKPYNLSEAWNVKSSTPSIPKWAAAAAVVDNEDMKAQIKFWARAVASNVRPLDHEC